MKPRSGALTVLTHAIRTSCYTAALNSRCSQSTEGQGIGWGSKQMGGVLWLNCFTRRVSTLRSRVLKWSLQVQFEGGGGSVREREQARQKRQAKQKGWEHKRAKRKLKRLRLSIACRRQKKKVNKYISITHLVFKYFSHLFSSIVCVICLLPIWSAYPLRLGAVGWSIANYICLN